MERSSMKVNWNFHRVGWEVQSRKPSVGGCYFVEQHIKRTSPFEWSPAVLTSFSL